MNMTSDISQETPLDDECSTSTTSGIATPPMGLLSQQGGSAPKKMMPIPTQQEDENCGKSVLLSAMDEVEMKDRASDCTSAASTSTRDEGCGKNPGPPPVNEQQKKHAKEPKKVEPVPTGNEVKSYAKRAGKRKQVVQQRYRKLGLDHASCLPRKKLLTMGNQKAQVFAGGTAAAAGVSVFFLGGTSMLGHQVQAVRTTSDKKSSKNLLQQKAARLEEKNRREQEQLQAATMGGGDETTDGEMTTGIAAAGAATATAAPGGEEMTGVASPTTTSAASERGVVLTDAAAEIGFAALEKKNGEHEQEEELEDAQTGDTAGTSGDTEVDANVRVRSSGFLSTERTSGIFSRRRALPLPTGFHPAREGICAAIEAAAAATAAAQKEYPNVNARVQAKGFAQALDSLLPYAFDSEEDKIRFPSAFVRDNWVMSHEKLESWPPFLESDFGKTAARLKHLSAQQVDAAEKFTKPLEARVRNANFAASSMACELITGSQHCAAVDRTPEANAAADRDPDPLKKLYAMRSEASKAFCRDNWGFGLHRRLLSGLTSPFKASPPPNMPFEASPPPDEEAAFKTKVANRVMAGKWDEWKWRGRSNSNPRYQEVLHPTMDIWASQAYDDTMAEVLTKRGVTELVPELGSSTGSGYNQKAALTFAMKRKEDDPQDRLLKVVMVPYEKEDQGRESMDRYRQAPVFARDAHPDIFNKPIGEVDGYGVTVDVDRLPRPQEILVWEEERPERRLHFDDSTEINLSTILDPHLLSEKEELSSFIETSKSLPEFHMLMKDKIGVFRTNEGRTYRWIDAVFKDGPKEAERKRKEEAHRLEQAAAEANRLEQAPAEAARKQQAEAQGAAEQERKAAAEVAPHRPKQAAKKGFFSLFGRQRTPGAKDPPAPRPGDPTYLHAVPIWDPWENPY
ncbi:unnamed protein product [Amoebophrya sp. A120]|nr:unnamed protein product [Amoebophrya sp. A120]|eukprot:GSA120T00016195001.1